LPSGWFSHPFLKNNFVISSDKQIEQIVKSGFKEVVIDTSKGTYIFEEMSNKEIAEKKEDNTNVTQPESMEAKEIDSGELREAVHNEKLPPEKRSKAVYNYSLKIVNTIFENPTTDNIVEGKKNIYEVVDVILGNNDTSKYLLNITSHDFYTYTHSVNVGVFAIMLSKELLKGYDPNVMRELGAGFFLHDLGKVDIDPNIIKKPDKLTPQERLIIRSHPQKGYNLLEKTNQLSEECKIIVMQHHERENGKGYPNGLRGNEIHLYARIASIADVLDALTSRRPYKEPYNIFDALRIMKDEMIDHFHKDIFSQFVMLFTKNLKKT